MFRFFFIGITVNTDLNKPINYIIILDKYYIFKWRINNKSLNLSVWKNEVKIYLLFEKKKKKKKKKNDSF